MFDIGLLELLLIAVISLLVLGPERLPGAVRSGAKTIYWFKRQASNAKEEIRHTLFRHDLKEPFPFENDNFDLVVSLGCIHNLSLRSVVKCLAEIERVGKRSYVMTESFRNDQEFFNLQCWALTAETLVDVDSWRWLHQQAGFSGDYEFIFFG